MSEVGENKLSNDQDLDNPASSGSHSHAMQLLPSSRKPLVYVSPALGTMEE